MAYTISKGLAYIITLYTITSLELYNYTEFEWQMENGTVVNLFLSRSTGTLMRQDSTLLLLIYQNPLKSPTLRLQLLLPRSLSLLLNKMLPLLQLLQRQTGKAAKIAGERRENAGKLLSII